MNLTDFFEKGVVSKERFGGRIVERMLKGGKGSSTPISVNEVIKFNFF